MRLKTITCVVLSLSLSACASRIKKLPVPGEDIVRSHRLMAAGDKLLKEGKDHLALLSYVEASTLNPYEEVIFNKLAISYSRLLLFTQSKKAVERALGLNPDYPFARNTEGIIFLASQQPGKAVKSFQKAIRLMPDNPNFYVNLANAYLHKDEFEKSRTAFQKALEIDPNVFELEGTIQIAASPEPPGPERYYQIARLFADLGEKEASLHYLGKALSNGFKDQNRLLADHSFKKMQADKDFIELVRAWGMQI